MVPGEEVGGELSLSEVRDLLAIVPVVAKHVLGSVGPVLVLGDPGVVVGHVGPLAQAAGEASPGGEVGGVAVTQVPLTNLDINNQHSLRCTVHCEPL